MAKTLNMVNTSHSQHNMNDHDDEDDRYQRGSPVYAWKQSTTSWGNFPGMKSLGHVTPLWNDGSDDEHDGEDMFSIFAWSSIVAKDQFSKGHGRAKNEEEPRTYAVDLVDRSANTNAHSADGSGGHRRSRRRASMGGSRPYSKSPGDITRRERFHRSRSKDSNCSSDSLSGDDDKPRKRRKSRPSRKHCHSSSAAQNGDDDEARILRKSRSSRKSSHSTSDSVPGGGVDADDPPQTHRRTQRRASMPLMTSPDTTYEKPEPQASRKSSHLTSHTAPDVGVEMEEPARAHRRVQRRSSMPMMTNPDTSHDEPEPQAKSSRSLANPETPSRRSKRRESLSSSSMLRTNELPKPRPVDMRLFPQALPFLEGLTPKTPETPSRSSRMLRRSSMPTSMSYTDNVAKPGQSDTTHVSPNSALNMPMEDDSYTDPDRRLAGRGRSSSRMKRRGSSGMSSDEVPVTPGGRDRPDGTRQIRRKSNEHHDFRSNNHDDDDDDDDVGMVASSRSRRRGSPTHDEPPSSPSGLEPRTPLRRSGRMSRRSSM